MTGRTVDMIRTGLLLLCLMPSLLMTPRSSDAADVADHATKVVRGLAADIWSSRDDIADADDRKRFLAGAIAARTNVDLLGRLALGRHWRSLDPADRSEYRRLFSEVVIGDLAGRLGSLLYELDGPLDQHFAITNSAVSGKKDVLVRSKVIAVDGRPLAVDWRLRDLENGLAIIDLVVEGISLLVSQRSEFASVIERSQIDGLIEALRHRAAAEDF